MEGNRPLFHRLANREAVNFRASSEGSHRDPRTGASFTGDFAGELLCWNPLGTFWNDYVQTGALAITIYANAEIGGCDRVRVIANGDAITLDPAYTWTNVGTEDISTVAADENILFVVKVSETEVEYAVKVE